METEEIRGHPQGRASPQAPNASICLSSIECFRASSKACSVPPPRGTGCQTLLSDPGPLAGYCGTQDRHQFAWTRKAPFIYLYRC